MGVSGQRHAPTVLYPLGKGPRYPLDRRLVGLGAGLDTEARSEVLKRWGAPRGALSVLGGGGDLFTRDIYFK
jgi:hypothetical protein